MVLRLVLAASMLLLAGTQAGCNIDGFCITCGEGGAGGDGGMGGGDGGMGGGDGGGDGGAFADACIPSGGEVCNGLDDDCDGNADEGDPGAGETCGTDVGLCQSGVTECVSGELICGGNAVNPAAEVCDGEDNDCDGADDNGNPGGGAFCGTDVGTCESGFTKCEAGDIICDGEVDTTGDSETCDGEDEDCDGAIDEDAATTVGNCGPATDNGICEFGSWECVGGVEQCVGAVFPDFEVCSAGGPALDEDCDNMVDENFDLDNDTLNCGTCGFRCETETNNVAAATCTLGVCGVGVCEAGYWDNANGFADGCEYGPCTFSSADEACNNADDNCDGEIDEGLDNPANAPDICLSPGECAGTIATCIDTGGGVYGWTCEYSGTGIVVVNGVVQPEANCDTRDNDCDNRTDEFFGDVGQECNDGEDGVCRDFGTTVCSSTNPSNTARNCDYGGVDPDANALSGPEVCDDKDNNCNGTKDEGVTREWVDIGGGIDIMAFEASRADADGTSAGINSSALLCSESGKKPWTNVTQPNAEQACLDLGTELGENITLCDEDDWEFACKLRDASGLIVVEAENFDRNTDGGDDWDFSTTQAGYSGTGTMWANDDDGTYCNADQANCPYLEFDFNFPTAERWYIWFRAYADDGNDDEVHFGIDGNAVSTADRGDQDDDDDYSWTAWDTGNNRLYIDFPAGSHTLYVWMGNDGLYLDKIILTPDFNYQPTGTGPAEVETTTVVTSCGWGFGSNCETWDPSVCNGAEYDTDGVAPGVQSAIIATGTAAMCFAEWGAAGQVYDLSGNVKEWTAERSPQVNPIRGGAYNNLQGALSCERDFLAGDDALKLETIGFRCCRDNN